MHSYFQGVRLHSFDGSANLGHGRLGQVGVGERLPIHERMPRCATFDFSQSSDVAALEITVAMSEFPKWRVWRAGVENIANYVALAFAPRAF